MLEFDDIQHILLTRDAGADRALRVPLVRRSGAGGRAWLDGDPGNGPVGGHVSARSMRTNAG